MKKTLTIALSIAFIGVFGQTKISDLPATTTLTGVELFPVVQGGVTKKTTAAQIVSLSAASATNYVPYSGATGSVNLGANSFSVGAVSTLSQVVTNTISSKGNDSLLFFTNSSQRFKINNDGTFRLSSTTNTNSASGGMWYNFTTLTGTAAPTGFTFYNPSNSFWEKVATFRNQSTGIHIQLSNSAASMAGWLKPMRNQGIGIQDSLGTTGLRVDQGGKVVINPSASGTQVAIFTVLGTMSVSGTSTLAGQTISQDRIRFVTNVAFTPSLSGSIYKSQDHGLAFHGVAGGTNDFIMATPAGQALFKNPTGSNNVILAESGKVRIGQNSIPSANLDVTGTMSVSSTATISGSTFESNAINLPAVSNSYLRNTGGNLRFVSASGAGIVFEPTGSSAAHSIFGYSLNVNTFTVSPQANLNVVGTARIATVLAGTLPSSSILELNSTTKGFLPPRMTATQGSAISSPAEGLMIYVTDTNGTFTAKGWWGYDGAAWQKLNN